MSSKHPVVAVTGSSGAGTSTVRRAFEHLFQREGVHACMIEGDSFHRHDRATMREELAAARAAGGYLSHFGAAANHFDRIEQTFREYGEHGTGQRRHYLHDEVEAAAFGQPPGTFTPWQAIPADTELLFYEGLHGAVVDGDIDVARHVDLKIGVVPIVNLEWIQKIHRDTAERGYSAEAVTETILGRMPDYIRYITPQFSRTDINFQRVPTVDTSNPFGAREVPTPDESFVVIRFRDPVAWQVDLPYLLATIHDAFLSRRNTLVVPGGKMGMAMEIILAPILDNLVRRARQLRAA